jgi:hypothetical protein
LKIPAESRQGDVGAGETTSRGGDDNRRGRRGRAV